MQPVQSALDSALADLIATGATFDPAAVFVGVGVSVTDTGVRTVLADIVQPTASVAVRQPITAWGDTFHLNNGSPYVDGPSMSFAPSSSADSTSVSVWYLATALTGGALIAFGYFPQAIPLPDQFSQAGIMVRLVLDAAGQWSAEVTWDS